MTKARWLMTAVLLVQIGTTAAQGVNMVNRPYQETPELPLARPGEDAMGRAGGIRTTGWTVTVEDKTIRKVVENWSKIEGWAFPTSNWTVDRDLPVAGSMLFQGDYKSAIRSLLSSSDLTDMPLQPCFYSNRVLRVVPRAELCDRMSTVN